MIPKIAYFYWNNNTPLSYFRYLTLETFRALHPDWDVKLYQSGADVNSKWTGLESQDFLHKKDKVDYIDNCKNLNIELIPYDNHQDKMPNFISDFFRWEMLAETGGWFFDLDQIFLKKFDDLNSYDFVIDGSKNCYVGVVGMAKNGIGKFINENIHRAYNPDHYCSIGPWYMLSLLRSPGDPNLIKLIQEHNSLLAPIEYFYPVISSDDVNQLYFETLDISDQSYAIHWYGGHPTSQHYNKHCKEENFFKPSNTITKYIKKILK